MERRRGFIFVYLHILHHLFLQKCSRVVDSNTAQLWFYNCSPERPRSIKKSGIFFIAESNTFLKLVFWEPKVSEDVQ